MSEIAVTHSDKVFFSLRHDIIEGKIPPGKKLSEAQLASDRSVSRAVVREAINRLEACHLVERKANVGAKVVELTPEGLHELYRVREALEGMAARLAAENMTSAEIAELRALLSRHSQQVTNDNHYYQEAGDVDFHYRIITGAHNRHLEDVLLNGLYHLIRMYRVQLGMTGPRITNAFNEHTGIVEAISLRDGELAEMLMRRHISYSQKSVQTFLDNSNKEVLLNVSRT